MKHTVICFFLKYNTRAVDELEHESWFCYIGKSFNKYVDKIIEDERQAEVAKSRNDDNLMINFSTLDFGQLTAEVGKVKNLTPQSTINNANTSSIISDLIPQQFTDTIIYVSCF